MYKFQRHLLAQNLWSEHMHIKLEEEREDEFLILPLTNFSFTKAVLLLRELTSRGTIPCIEQKYTKTLWHTLYRLTSLSSKKQSEDYDVLLNRHVVWSIHRDIATL